MEDQELNAIEKARRFVNLLVEYRDTFINVYGIENGHKKNNEVEEKLKETIAQLDHLQFFISNNKAVFFFLRGKALNVTQSYDHQAEECLTKAVKLDPNMIEAWNELGECYWKNQKISSAENCFTHALAKGENKVSFRNLSMVQRQLGESNYDEKVRNIRLSVDTAKKAVAMDFQDGQSWFVLGNAYLSEYFFAGQSPSILQKCLGAYTRAMKDTNTSNNPDLHNNRAVAYKYQEDYSQALEGYRRAMLLDPSWTKLKEDYTDLVLRLKYSHSMIEMKGQLKPKKIQNLINHIKEADLGPYIGGSYRSPLNKTIALKSILIKELVNGRNDNTVIYGKVVAVIPVKDGVPFSFVLMDKSGTCIAISVFNLALNKGVLIGDSIAIPEPFVQHIKIQLDVSDDITGTYNDCKREEELAISFQSIRVDNPLVLVINKRKVGQERMACSVLSVTNECN